MTDSDRTKYLRIALFMVGLIFIVGIYPLLGIYATLGVFLVIASRDPLAHRSLIWFTVWSSVVNGGIMAVQSLGNSQYMGHLWGDVLALFVVAIALALLTPRGVGVRVA
jgi:hypothetical protein